MDTRKLLALSLAGTLSLLLPARARADKPDAWITTKVKIALLTTDGVSGTAVKVDTTNGRVTLHGKVNSEAEKKKAETTTTSIEGVKDVRNLLQVVPESREKAVAKADSEVKKHVEKAIEVDKTLDGIKVASVDNGVVLLSGKTNSLGHKLKAIEVAYGCDGVRRVATEIETEEK